MTSPSPADPSAERDPIVATIREFVERDVLPVASEWSIVETARATSARLGA